jgi:arylsulfatase A-like enzyme
LGAAVFYVADARILVDLYDEFHDGLHVAFLILLVSAALLVRSGLAGSELLRAGWRLPNTAVRGVLVGMPLLTMLAVFADAAPLRAAVRAKGALTAQRAVALLRAATDLDGDGYSSLLSGGDCAGFDAAIAPGNFDIPGNDVDEDCSGADTRWPKFERTESVAKPVQGMNVLLISIDTLRADRLSVYGHTRPTSPNIDALANAGWSFSHAYSQSSKTFDSIPSFLTGLYPTNLPRDYVHLKAKKVKEYVYTLTRDAQTMAGLFKAKGYTTRAFGAFELLRQLGLDRGFDKFTVGRKQVAGSVKFLSTARTPFFLWVHFDEPHWPYEKNPKHDFGSTELDRYDAEIATVDAFVGQVLKALDDNGLRDNTLVALTADHGEEFGEHGGRYHAPKLYEELLHVPLIVSIPGQAPARIDEVVELVDLAPTVCESLFAAKECGDFDGQSLWHTVLGKRNTAFGFGGAYGESLFSRQRSSLVNRSLATLQWRFTQRTNKVAFELYDRTLDPTESRNVIDEQAAAAEPLRSELLIRPYRMLAPAFTQARAGDVRELVAVLPRIREEGMLGYALGLLEAHPPAGASGNLRKLLERPELTQPFKERVKRLVTRVDGKRKGRSGSK